MAEREDDGRTRNRLTYIVTGIGFAAICVISGTVLGLSNGDTRQENSRLVFSSVLPLVGTWIGTVLAYYFSAHNFDTATKSVTNMARELTTAEKLKAVPVEQVMLPRSAIDELPDAMRKPLAALERQTIKAILDFLASKGRQRAPVFDDRGAPRYMIHASALTGFVAAQVLAAQVPDARALTFGDLLTKAPDLKALFETSFVVVARSKTLADAKDAMLKQTKCEDVFVTATGARDESVVGWLTDNDITKYAAT